MNYKEMTGPELCMAVAKKWLPEKEHEFLKIKKCRHEGEYLEYWGDKYDPENNPSDAWPIILENKINIAFAASSDESQASGGYYCCMDKNPLRAAMIVFLMMGEG